MISLISSYKIQLDSIYKQTMDVDFSDIGSGGGNNGNDDITSELLQRFSCMNTTDRDVLIQQFKVLLGEKCTESNAEFWLDMNNWYVMNIFNIYNDRITNFPYSIRNLQAAVCSYFDFESQNNHSLTPYMIKLPSMSFITMANFVDRYPPNTPFVYQCIVNNSGNFY